MAYKIRIIAKRDGFRRCGIAHPETPTLYDSDEFSAEEVAALGAEPMLVVDLVEVDDAGEAKLVASTSKPGKGGKTAKEPMDT